MSQAVVDASAGFAVAFSVVGPAELKGVAGRVRLHVARRAEGLGDQGHGKPLAREAS